DVVTGVQTCPLPISYIDLGPPYGARLVYTVRATLPDRPKVEGAPAEEAGVDYRDVFPPPAPARLDALSEKALVRLVWDPVPAARSEERRVGNARGGQ